MKIEEKRDFHETLLTITNLETFLIRELVSRTKKLIWLHKTRLRRALTAAALVCICSNRTTRVIHDATPSPHYLVYVCTYKPARRGCNDATRSWQRYFLVTRYSARDPCFSKQQRERALNSGRSARQTFSEEFWNFAKWRHKCLFGDLQIFAIPFRLSPN